MQSQPFGGATSKLNLFIFYFTLLLCVVLDVEYVGVFWLWGLVLVELLCVLWFGYGGYDRLEAEVGYVGYGGVYG